MIIPSIDISAGRAVQLVGGETLAIDAGDPMPWLDRFRVAGEVAIVDLDAARREGSNGELIARMCATANCRVGGGIRDYETACRWLDIGAARIVIGTAAEPTLLRRLPTERIVVALDAQHDEVVVDGWRKHTGRTTVSRLAELRDLAGGFLVTFVEREGRLAGTDLERAARIIRAAGDAAVTVAGGVTTPAEVAALDALGADAQVGMALYAGRLRLGDAVAACFATDRHDGLIPTVVTDERGSALGLAWSSRATLAEAIDTRQGIYHSRTRGRWVKGASSGASQILLRVDADCDRDTVRFAVRQRGPGFCHRGTPSCWGDVSPIATLESVIAARMATSNSESYTARLLADSDLLHAKLVEEAGELADAGTPSEATSEAADLLYFTLVCVGRWGVRLADIERELGNRARRVTRRPGNAKRVGEVSP